ncbi:MAG TPA: hypothetical protein V6D50_00325 [Chroococcales cyanobacterium]
MHRKKWLGLVIGTSLVGSALNALPAKAGDLTQSDIGGTNIWNGTAPIFKNEGKIDSEIIDNARRLSRNLEDSSNRCANAKPTGPRRFARGPAPNEVCISPECEQLNGLVQETRGFLTDVNRQVQEAKASRSSQLW